MAWVLFQQVTSNLFLMTYHKGKTDRTELAKKNMHLVACALYVNLDKYV